MEIVVSTPPFNVEIHTASALVRRGVTPSRRSSRERRLVSMELLFGNVNGYMNNTDAEEGREEDNNSEIRIIPEEARLLPLDDMDEDMLTQCSTCTSYSNPIAKTTKSDDSKNRMVSTWRYMK